MQNIREFTSGRRRLLTSTVVALAAMGAAALTAVSIPAEAAQVSDFSIPVFRSPARIQSIFVSTTGVAHWSLGFDQSGAVGSLEQPATLDICYTYFGAHNGAPVNSGQMYAYVNQAPGKQGPTPVPSDSQRSATKLLGGSRMSILTFRSPDCTGTQAQNFKGFTVPTSGGTFELDLTKDVPVGGS